MARKVAILGGGVGGMSAAHELIERGFEVDVYEARPQPGGKARTIYVQGSGKGGRSDLPGEHGFRFFPGFYKHLPDTMKRIPYGDRKNKKFVHDNLVQASQYLIAQSPEKQLKFLVRFPESPLEWRRFFESYISSLRLDLPPGEGAYFVQRLMVILTSCEERRLEEYEKISWWHFIGAQERSEPYKMYLAQGLTRSLVAMRAEEASARTVGNILLQLLLEIYVPGYDFDRVLNGPTSEVWLNPWLKYLKDCGVNFHFNAPVTDLFSKRNLMTGARVIDDGSEVAVQADYYVAAMPIEKFRDLVTEDMRQFAPELGHLYDLQFAWMNGIQFFLYEDAPLVHGHINHVASPWALTSISQAQFWPQGLRPYGDGTVKGCFSVDISDWTTPGVHHTRSPAESLVDREDIRDEVLAQVRSSLPKDLAKMFESTNIHTWFLDSDIAQHNPYQGQRAKNVNLEPLLINTAGSWQYRPEAATSIRNLFLAADFVRTNTDLATMEAANEAARRAVNAILDVSGSSAERCKIWPLHEPEIFRPLRAYDALRFRRGLPHAFGEIVSEPPRTAPAEPERAIAGSPVESKLPVDGATADPRVQRVDDGAYAPPAFFSEKDKNS